MPWWKAGNSSSPSASPSDEQHPNDVSTPHQPRLTRQRKLRHLSDLEIGDLARSHSSLENFHPRVSTSVPQPLPLPESGTKGRQNAMAVRGDGEEGNVHMELSSHLLAVEPIWERFVPPPKMGSRLCQPSARRSTDHADAFGFKHGHNKNGFRDAKTSEDGHYRLTTPERSGATIGLCSPGFSPGRLSTGETFPSAYMVPRIPHMWSAPELPSSDFIADLNLQTSMEKPFAGHDRSPYSQTAKSPGPKSRNPSAPCSPLHSKMFVEMSTIRHENHGNANVHPLPLPPGAPPSLQPSFGHQMSSFPNQWQKGKLIGSGTFGNVYIAINRHTGALCAMKEVNLIPDDPKSAECIKQLQQEIKLLSKLKHPNIVQYYGSEIIEDRFYICLEYVYPGSINKYVNEHCGAVTESVVRNFTRHILRGLSYLHSTKTMHRDIKGANLLVDSCGVVKLADFGMAKHRKCNSTNSGEVYSTYPTFPDLTVPNIKLSGAKDVLSLKGTPYWMAPEVLQATMNKELSYDLAIDIWSLGCTIIEMFTGRHPWSGFESAAAMFKILHESPHIPETLSAEGKDFLQLCFRRNPTERPTASQLLEHPFVMCAVQHDLHGLARAPSQPRLSSADHQPLSALQF